MAKKKKSVELSDKNINFEMDKQSIKIIRFHPTSMEVDVIVNNNGKLKMGMQTLPFAHLPKNIKKLIKPN